MILGYFRASLMGRGCQLTCFAVVCFLSCYSRARAESTPLVVVTKAGESAETKATRINGKQTLLYKCDKRTGPLILQPGASWSGSTTGTLYIALTYLDKGYGRIIVQVARGSNVVNPDRYLDLSRMDTGRMVTARMRIPQAPAAAGGGDLSVRIEPWNVKDQPFWVSNATLDDQPFSNPQFAYVISDPWLKPYTGTAIKAADNTTLKGKVMVGYQGWFRTPNDPDGKGWRHWGNIHDGTFTTDMWPDVRQYPPTVLEKAADVRTRKGKVGYLFSSDWPKVADIHFRWMREHDIDGAFLQRFLSDQFNSTDGTPEWVLANVRAAANQHGRIWAIEYDVSGYPDSELLGTLKKDWTWLVDTFGLLKDPNYAREGGKPVVFIWGMPLPDRDISTGTANAVVDFFKNDPKYGNNYVIGGVPGNWRKLDEPWQEHLKKYDAVLSWMSQSYAEDIADFQKMGLTYYAHVKPGFSWANLKHLPTGDTTTFMPREGGRYYWNSLSKAAKAGVDRLFVGMFDEYDESTAIMPMSDDPPPTPVLPGVGATFYNGSSAREHGAFVRLSEPALQLESTPPAKGISPHDFFARLGGRIIFPSSGTYTFSIQGAEGDDATLVVNRVEALDAKNMNGTVVTGLPVTVAARGPLTFRLEYRHAAANGALQLLWESSSVPRQPIPSAVMQDAWGRFLTNEGRPSDWWLTLTSLGKKMMNGKLSPDSPMPEPK